MPRPRWTKLASRVLAENPWWRYRRDDFELPDGRRGEYHVASTHGSVMIVPVDRDGRLVLVEQYRFLADRDSLELPAGGLEEGEPPLDAATRELAEETGLAGVLEPIGAFCPWNGVTDERCHVFRATDLRALADAPAPDDTEDLVVRRLTLAELDARIVDGTLWDGMTLAALAIHRLRA